MTSRSLTTAACVAALTAGVIATLSMPAEASRASDALTAPAKLGLSSTFGLWPDGTLTYTYNPTGAPPEFASDSHFLELLERSMDEIEGVADVSFVFAGVDESADWTDFSDGIVVVAWADIGGGSAGLAGPASPCLEQDVTDFGFCPYFDGRALFNNAAGNNWDLTGNADTTARRFHQVATHELLHLLGIGHSDDYLSIMFADPYTFLSHLRDDDIAALQALYGPPRTFVAPEPWTLSQAVDHDPIDIYTAFDDDLETDVATVAGGESATFLAARIVVDGPYSATVAVVTLDPDGYYYQRNQQDVECEQGLVCSGWFSVAPVRALQNYPGIWTFEVIVDGVTDEIITVTSTVTPSRNEPPNSTLAFTRTRGVIPLRITGRLEVTADKEGDAVDLSWHIPGEGETDVAFGAGSGRSFRTLTFADAGDHDVYVEVNDDWIRYGTPGSGRQAGVGFRELYRQPIEARHTLTDTVGLNDVNQDGNGDIAVLIESAAGVSNRLYVIDGDSGATLFVRSIGDSDVSIREIKAIGDINGDSVGDIAVLARDLVQGSVFIDVTDPTTGTQITRIFYEPAFEPIAIVEVPCVPDGNSMSSACPGNPSGPGLDSYPDLGVLGDDEGVFRIQLKDPGTGALISKVFFDPDYYPLGVEVINADGDARPDYAVVGLDAARRVRAQIKDVFDGEFKGLVYFDKRYLPLAVAQGVDLDMNGIDDLIVLGTDGFGRVRAQVKDASTGTLTGLVYFLKNREFLDFVVVPGNDSANLGVLARDTRTGLIQLQMKNAATATLENLIRFDSANDPWGIAVVPDINGSAVELSVLGEARNGNWRIQMKDSQSRLPLLNRVVP